MTEGPEATYLSNRIRKRFLRKQLSKIRIVDGRYKHHGPPIGFREFTKALPLRLQRVEKKGKVIFMFFELGWCLISKMGMSGWWWSEKDDPHWRPTPNLIFEFTDGVKLNYGDFRNFGTLEFTNNSEEIQAEFDRISPDILSEDTKFNQIRQRFEDLQARRPRLQIQEVLMDQKLLFSGIGNILKAEVLYSSRISPIRTLSSLNLDELKRIYLAGRRWTRRILKFIEERKMGEWYQDILQVYEKEVDPFGNPVKRQAAKGERTTFWVPAVQE